MMDKNRSNAYNFRKQHEIWCDEVTKFHQPGKGLLSDVGVLLAPNTVRIVPEAASPALSGRSLIPPVNEAQNENHFSKRRNQIYVYPSSGDFPGDESGASLLFYLSIRSFLHYHPPPPYPTIRREHAHYLLPRISSTSTPFSFSPHIHTLLLRTSTPRPVPRLRERAPRHSRAPTPPTAGATPSLFDERHKTPRNLPLPLLAAVRGNLSRTKRRKPRLAIQGEARAWTPALLSSTSLDLDPTASTPRHPAPSSPPHPPPPRPRPPSLPGGGRCPRGRKR
jgi:hypothetical protein